MSFLNFLQTLNENIKNGIIAFGVRDVKNHDLIKTFPLHHLYTELKKFKENEGNDKKFESGEWKLTNELELDGLRKYQFVGDSEKHLVKSSEKPIESSRKVLKFSH